MQIYNNLDVDISKAYFAIMRWGWRDFDDFMQKYGEFKNTEVWTENASKIHNYFTRIGVLLKRNMIDSEIASELFGHVIVKIWEKLASIILEYRIRYSSDKWSQVEYLYPELKPYRDKRLEQILSIHQ